MKNKILMSLCAAGVVTISGCATFAEVEVRTLQH
jgi:hypothetical protein